MVDRGLHDSAAGQPSCSGRCLVVDDNECLRNLLANMLRAKGAKVATRGNGLEALQAVQSERYDLVLMDLEMPLMDGLTAITCMRDEGFDAPALAVTGHYSDELYTQCIEAGFNEVLAKPFQRAELLRICADFLEKSASLA